MTKIRLSRDKNIIFLFIEATVVLEYNIIKKTLFKLSNLNKIRIYCNNEYKKISATYNQKVMNVTDEWIITNNKYKINDYKSNINLSGNNHEASGSNDN